MRFVTDHTVRRTGPGQPGSAGGTPSAGRRAVWSRRQRGFTLLELLVVISIIALLLSLLLPALSAVRGTMKTLKCATNLRSVSFKFQLFAEGLNDEGRGDSEKLERGGFYVNDFQESLYRIDEFWDQPGQATAELTSRRDLMLCPAGVDRLVRRSGFPCSSAALGPAEEVTVGVNMRLYRAVVMFKGKPVLAPAASTHVRQDVLSHPHVPLMMDIDGKLAARRGIEPFYSAPPVAGVPGAYDDGHYWVPGTRHRGRTNVAFVGGHVLTSEQPEREIWDWKYQGEVGR